MNTLYPLKFTPILKEKIWGGKKLANVLNKSCGEGAKTGESWEISAIQGDISVVSNGFLEGNNLQEIIEIYMGDLLGDSVFYKFGIEFPILIKFLDASEFLSVQVHPDDNLALKRHNAYGKTEMWYIIEADAGSQIITGFSKPVDMQKFSKSVESGELIQLLNFENAKAGDVFFIPSGRIHATGAGILLAEIQQTSDITYRIYDWDRMEKGKPRDLHIGLANDALDFSIQDNYRTDYHSEPNKACQLIKCSYFTANLIEFDLPRTLSYELLDSFVIHICLKGNYRIVYQGREEIVSTGETVLIPAVIKELQMIPSEGSKILEIYISVENFL